MVAWIEIKTCCYAVGFSLLCINIILGASVSRSQVEKKIKDSAVFWSIQLLTTLDLVNVSQEGLLHKPKSRTMCGEFFVHASGQHS